MDLRQLEYFVQIAAHGSFNKASARLHVAQSALSRRMQQLEHELGVELFERSAHGARLTGPGLVMASRASDLVRQVRDLREELKAQSGVVHGEVAVGVPAILRPTLGSPLLHAMGKAHPQIQMTLITGLSHDLRERAMDGRLDLAVYGMIEPDHVLKTTPIMREDLLLVSAPTSPHAALQTIEPSALRDVALVVFSREMLRRLLRRLGAGGNMDFERVLEVSDGPLQIEMVLTGRFSSVLPRVMVQEHLDAGRLVAARLSGGFYHWAIGHAPDRGLSPCARLAQGLLLDLAQKRLTTGGLVEADPVTRNPG